MNATSNAALHRYGDWIATAGGGAFWPLDPAQLEINIGDIAAGLSRICRFGGQLQVDEVETYSVAQHSVLVCDAVTVHHPGEPLLQLAALMHDAAEAYLGDIVRPLKVSGEMAPLRAAMDRLERAIAQRFGYPHPMPLAVQTADDEVLCAEVRCFMPHLHARGWNRPAVEPWPHRIVALSPRAARIRFLERFAMLRMEVAHG